jgi:hypothetical protein
LFKKGKYPGSSEVRETSNIFTRDLAKAREDTRRNYEKGAPVPPPQTAKISFDFTKEAQSFSFSCVDSEQYASQPPQPDESLAPLSRSEGLGAICQKSG